MWKGPTGGLRGEKGFERAAKMHGGAQSEGLQFSWQETLRTGPQSDSGDGEKHFLLVV